ncbi:MAG TPA: AMP-binding protein, partial [Terriglobales bacterium]
MLDLDQYTSLGAALRAALERWPNETCLIESDRDREKLRLTYSDFKDLALPLARALQDAEFRMGDRAAIIMTNQSKWLVSAYAIFYCGGVLVPLDYKLSATEHLQLLAHSKARFLVVEYYLWRTIMQAPEFERQQLTTVLVTEAPPGVELEGAYRWEDFHRKGEPVFVSRQPDNPACIVYSSGTGGRPKGCVLTHENYLEQCKALTALFPFWPGVRYLSILPTNHAIDFMVGFIGPFVCGACVVHLRTLRPEFVRDAFVRYEITYVSLVPLVLKNLERGLKAKFEGLSSGKQTLLKALIGVNRALTRRRPHVPLTRKLLPQVHKAFGGHLLAMFTGGAFMEPSTLQFFYDIGIPVANGWGLTEAGTALTLNDFKPFRADSVGKPLPGVELRILNPDAEGIGEVAARSKTIMSHYLDDPELTGKTIVDGWLLTGDLGRLDGSGHLQLFGRKKNMIVTEGGKNIYPEDIEGVFEGLPVKEYCIFAANYV